jgi:hypothetical protein
MDPNVYPDSHLSEVGRKERNFMLQKLTRLAYSIKNEKEIRLENPNKAIATHVQSIEYHTTMINSYAETRLRHIQKAIEQINEEYHRKLKLSLDALEKVKVNLKAEENYKTKALLRYEKEFDSLSKIYEKTFGKSPISIIDVSTPSFTDFKPLNIVDTNDTSDIVKLFTPLKKEVVVEAPLKQIELTDIIKSFPFTPAVEMKKEVVQEVKKPLVPEPIRVEVTHEIPRSFMYTDDPNNPIMTLEEIEMAKARCADRGIPFTLKLYDTKPYIIIKKVDTTPITPLTPAAPPPTIKKKPLNKLVKRDDTPVSGNVMKYSKPSLRPSSYSDDEDE